MSDPKTRGPAKRWYIRDDNALIGRMTGIDDEVVEIETADRLAVEGYIHLRSRGCSHADIISGAALPDRVLPNPKREMTDWQKAIAQVKAADLMRAKKAGGVKIGQADRDDAARSAVVWTMSLTKEQTETLKKGALVKAAHADITGETGSLDEMLAKVVVVETAAPEPEPVVLDQAAD